MIHKKFKTKKGELPAYVLVHYKSADNVYNFRIATPENAYTIKKELIESGMTDVTIPILEYRAKQLMEQGGGRK